MPTPAPSPAPGPAGNVLLDTIPFQSLSGRISMVPCWPADQIPWRTIRLHNPAFRLPYPDWAFAVMPSPATLVARPGIPEPGTPWLDDGAKFIREVQFCALVLYAARVAYKHRLFIYLATVPYFGMDGDVATCASAGVAKHIHQMTTPTTTN